MADVSSHHWCVQPESWDQQLHSACKMMPATINCKRHMKRHTGVQIYNINTSTASCLQKLCNLENTISSSNLHNIYIYSFAWQECQVDGRQAMLSVEHTAFPANRKLLGRVGNSALWKTALQYRMRQIMVAHALSHTLRCCFPQCLALYRDQISSLMGKKKTKKRGTPYVSEQPP